MKTYLVIPDEHNGGSDWECFVVAESERQACEMVRAYLGDESTEPFIPVDEDNDPRCDHRASWVVRELPAVVPATLGVIGWDTFKLTQWRAEP